MIVRWVVTAFRFLFRWFYGRWLPTPGELEAMRPGRLPPPWKCPRCGLPHRIATCLDTPPLSLDVGLTRPAIGMRAVRPLTQVEQIIDANGPAWNPYEYWRALWLRDGDPEALRQMERFVTWRSS